LERDEKYSSVFLLCIYNGGLENSLNKERATVDLRKENLNPRERRFRVS
jgi:hypothetical protein